MKVHPMLRRAAVALRTDLRWGEPLKVRLAASAWAIAVGQAARDADEVKSARAAAAELAELPDDDLRDAAASLSLPGGAEPDRVRELLAGVDDELFRLLADHGDAELPLPDPRRGRGPDVVGQPLSEELRRAFGTWLSWDIFDPYSAAQLAWGTAAVAADLDGRLDTRERREESERLRALLDRWDTVSLLALERCCAGSWLESDALEDALAQALDTIATRLEAPRVPRSTSATGPLTPLPLTTLDWPVGMATRFDNANAQLQAKRRAERLLEEERPPTSILVEGKFYPNMVSFVVGTTSDSFGDGAIVERDRFGRPRPGRPVGHVFKLKQARIIFTYEESRWTLVTGYPTDEPLTSR